MWASLGLSPCHSEKLLVHRVDTGEPVPVHSLETAPCPLGTLTSRVICFGKGMASGHPKASHSLGLWAMFIQWFPSRGFIGGWALVARNPSKVPKRNTQVPVLSIVMWVWVHPIPSKGRICFVFWDGNLDLKNFFPGAASS